MFFSLWKLLSLFRSLPPHPCIGPTCSLGWWPITMGTPPTLLAPRASSAPHAPELPVSSTTHFYLHTPKVGCREQVQTSFTFGCLYCVSVSVLCQCVCVCSVSVCVCVSSAHRLPPLLLRHQRRLCSLSPPQTGYTFPSPLSIPPALALMQNVNRWMQWTDIWF